MPEVQSPDAFGRISGIFYVKAESDLWSRKHTEIWTFLQRALGMMEVFFFFVTDMLHFFGLRPPRR